MNLIYYAPYSFSLKRDMPLDKAPRIRHYHIYYALKKNHNIYCICGDYQERKEAIKKFKEEENILDYNGLYCESHNWPLRNIDYRFFKFCKNKIPTTIFYRDCYWKTKDFLKIISIKKIQSYFRFFIEFKLFKKYFDHFFVPTESFAHFCKLKNYSILPPAGNIRKINRKKSDDVFKIVFAGNKKTGYDIIFKIMDNILFITDKIELHIISTDIPEKKMKNVYYHHSSLYENEALLQNCYLGLIPREKSLYHDFSFPLKLMDYLSWGFPVISTDTFEVKNFIEKHEVGISVKHNAKAFSDSIISLYQNRSLWSKYNQNALNLIRTSENWDKRAEIIVERFMESAK